MVKSLLEHENIHPDRADSNDRTPLTWATTMGHESIVKLLLDRRDVDPNRLDKHGSTPLSYASMERHQGIMQLLHARKSVETQMRSCPTRCDLAEVNQKYRVLN